MPSTGHLEGGRMHAGREMEWVADKLSHDPGSPFQKPRTCALPTLGFKAFPAAFPRAVISNFTSDKRGIC